MIRVCKHNHNLHWRRNWSKALSSTKLRSSVSGNVHKSSICKEKRPITSIQLMLYILRTKISHTCRHTAVVVFATHQDVSVVTPVGTPRVLDQPIWLPIELTVPNRYYSVIHVIRSTLAVRFVKDAMGVEAKGLMSCIDAHSNRSVHSDGHLQGFLVTGSHVDVRSDLTISTVESL